MLQVFLERREPRALRLAAARDLQRRGAAARSAAALLRAPAGASCTTCTGRPRPRSTSRTGRARASDVGRSCRSAARSRTLGSTCSTSACEPVPIGVPGELYIGGVQVGARLPQPAGADGRAVRARSVRGRPGARMYRTGDLARWLADGEHRVPRPRWTTRSRSAASASSSARSRRRSPTIRRCAKRSWSRAKIRPGDKRLVAYVVPNAEPAQRGAQRTGTASRCRSGRCSTTRRTAAVVRLRIRSSTS